MATNKKLFSIRDSKAEIYDPPFPQHTHSEAERTFGNLANDPKTRIGSFPEDFDLYHLGSFDDATGKLEMLPSPQHMVKAINLVKAKSSGLNA